VFLRILLLGFFVIQNILTGCASCIFAESPVEVGHIVEAHLHGNLRNGATGLGGKQLGGKANALGVGVVDEGIPRVLLEGRGKIGRRKHCGGCHILQGDALGEIIVDISQCGENRGIVFGGSQSDFAVCSQAQQRGCKQHNKAVDERGVAQGFFCQIFLYFLHEMLKRMCVGIGNVHADGGSKQVPVGGGGAEGRCVDQHGNRQLQRKQLQWAGRVGDIVYGVASEEEQIACRHGIFLTVYRVSACAA